MALADEETFVRTGTLQFLDNQLDPSTGTINGRAVFKNADRRLTPGLFVRLRLPGTVSYAGVLVEDRAVGTDLDRRFVLVVDGDKKVAVAPGRPWADGRRAPRRAHRSHRRRTGRRQRAAARAARRPGQRGDCGDGWCAVKFSSFFITRPIFAIVLSALIVVGGGLALLKLPVSEYPAVVPPTVVVHAAYPGANPKVIAETVAAPLEQQMNGVEGMLYMFSQATSDGALTLTITFALGTDLDNAQVQVQNRVAQTLPRLPQDVQRIGVTTEKASPDFIMVVHLVSPDERYDMLYLSNYAHLQVRDELTRLPGVGLGAGVRRRRVQHARVAGSRSPGLAAAHRQRRRPGHPRTERPGRGRRAGGAAGAVRRDLSAVDQHPGPSHHRVRVRQHRGACH